ncbi:MAG: hypothetical protein GXY13_14825 [Acidimicrobiales bacterium]|nr:hypothetical protein [Acidimicrobiales bacterium]
MVAPPLDVGDGWAVGASSLTWFLVSLVAGRWAARLPPERLSRTGPFTRLRSWEEDGAVWQRRLRVTRWKDSVPEAGGVFAGGYPKRRIRSRATEDLRHFRRETIRAERVHWLILASTPVHLLWCRPALAAAMAVFGVLFTAPFIIIQRYNRGRLDRLIARRGG